MGREKRPKLNWSIPANEYDRFTEWVEERHGMLSPYAGFEAERAMRGYMDEDDAAALQPLVDRLAEAGGYSPARAGDEKNSLTRPSADGPPKRFRFRVSDDVAEAFREFAHEHDAPFGRALAAAMREHRDGGRVRRLAEKLEQVAPDAVAALAGDDADATAAAGAVERRERRISQELGASFTREDYAEAVAAATSLDPTGTQAQEKYLPGVVDRKGVARHPAKPDLFIPVDQAREFAAANDLPGPDAPAVDRKDYRDLTRPEKVTGLRLSLARRAADGNGRSQFDAATARDDVFDGRASASHVHDLLLDAADADGFDHRERRGTPFLRVDLAAVTDDALLSAVTDTASGTDTDPPEGEGGAAPDADTGTAVDPDEAAAELDALADATTARTDGGTDEG